MTKSWIDEVEHPAAHQGRSRPIPAGQVVGAILIAFALAGLFTSASIVHNAEAMNDGVTRTVVLAAGRPLNRFAQSIGLTRPVAALEALVNNQALVASNTALTNGSNNILRIPHASPSPSVNQGHRPTGHQTPGASPSATPTPLYPQDVGGVVPVSKPTAASPLRLLVTGDSLSTYVGYQLANDVTHKVKVTLKSYDGTGLTRPDFFNWQLAAERLSSQYHPQAVVVVLGGNDGWNMTHDGKFLTWGSQGWITEYARRVAVVARTFLDHGAQRVYWAGPPTAASAKWNGIFRDLNEAVATAVRATPGARFVNLYDGTAVNGRYTQVMTIDGKRVNTRQSDGIHFSLPGAQLPAELFLASLQREYGPLTAG